MVTETKKQYEMTEFGPMQTGETVTHTYTEDGGFWGRTCARLSEENKGLKNLIKEINRCRTLGDVHTLTENVLVVSNQDSNDDI